MCSYYARLYPYFLFFRNLAFLKAELHPVDIYPKYKKKENGTDEKREADECEKDRKIHADLKYNLIQTSGVYIWNQDIGKVKMNFEEKFLIFFIKTSKDSNVYFFFSCKKLYICFRGTASVKNAITDAKESVTTFY